MHLLVPFLMVHCGKGHVTNAKRFQGVHKISQVEKPCYTQANI